MSAPGWTTAAAGFALGLSLIVVIGAQNAHVLRVGLRRDRVGLVVGICAASDLVLIAAGAAGLGRVVGEHRGLLVAATLLGVVVLSAYAVQAVRRAARPSALQVDHAGTPTSSISSLAATTAALTWLNPHVYLDTVVLLGSVAAAHAGGRWWFAGGAGAASVVWFTALGYGSGLARPLFARPAAWRVFDLGVAAVMAVTVVTLLAGLRR